MDISQRIKERMALLKLKQVDLVKLTGASKGAISQWINGISTPSGKHLMLLAKALRTSPDWLINGGGAKGQVENAKVHHNNVELGPTIYTAVPLLNWVQAGSWQAIAEIEPYEVKEFRETTARVSSKAFALRVVGDSMVSQSGSVSIPEGSIVIVDPEITPESGKIVIAKLEDSNEATIKKLVIDGPNKYLMPLNTRYSPIYINGNCSIIGVVKKVEIDL